MSNFRPFQALYQSLNRGNPRLFEVLNRIHDVLQSFATRLDKLEDDVFKFVGPEFLDTKTDPDGIRTTFYFDKFPLYVLWNGLLQFPGTPGYTITSIGSSFVITFVDAVGNPLVPASGDSIKAKVV